MIVAMQMTALPSNTPLKRVNCCAEFKICKLSLSNNPLRFALMPRPRHTRQRYFVPTSEVNVTKVSHLTFP